MSQHRPPVRALAPAGTSDSSRESSSNGRNQSDPPLLQSGLGPSKRNASIACLNCKSAKRKCDQGNPCATCRNTDKECVYDASRDGRRKEVRKRRLDELEFRSNALDRLLLKLRNSSQAEARELIDLIKRDAPLEEILDFIEKNPGELADETKRALSASPPPPDGAGIRRMLAISELIDMPTFQVEVGPWTTVTSDNAFVSNVLSAYYNWFHWHYVNFDWELFLEAFKAKDLESPYCSPLLVNAVLGVGCMFSDHPSALADSGDSETRGQHFYNEAQRLYELEGDCLTLANVQAFTILIMLAAFAGKDRISSASLKKLEVIVPKLLSQYAIPNPEQPITPEMQRSLAITDAFGISFMAPPTWSKPTLERPYQSDSWKSHLTPWSPYPLNQEPIQIPQHALSDEMAVAYIFMGEVQTLLFAEFSKLNALQKYEAAQELDSRILAWYDSLPAEHRYDQPPFLIVPATVDLALAIFFARLFLWNWTTPPPNEVKRTLQGEARYEPDSVEGRKAGSKTVEEIRTSTLAIGSQIVESVVSIGRRFDEQYGPTYHSMLMPQSGIFCANFLLAGNLHSAHEEELLLQIMQILVQASKRWQLVKGVTQMLLKGSEEKVKALSSPLAERDDEQSVVPAPGKITKELFESMELIVKDMAWSPSDYLHFSSRYPNYLVAKEDPTVELSNMLEQWAQLALEEIALREGEDENVEMAGYDDSNDNDTGPQAPPVQSIERDDVPMADVEEVEDTTIIADKESSKVREEIKSGDNLESAPAQSEILPQEPVEQQSKAINVQKSGQSNTDTPETAIRPQEQKPQADISQTEAGIARSTSESHTALTAHEGHESADNNLDKSSAVEAGAAGKQLPATEGDTTYTTLEDVAVKQGNSGTTATISEQSGG